MKNSKYLFYAMAASLSLVGCNNDEFGYNENVANDEMVNVEELNLVFAKSGSEAQTKAEWIDKGDGLKFAWTSADDAIGMVYTGQGGTTGVTNYKFSADSLQLADFTPKADQTRWTGFYGIGEALSSVKAAYTKADGQDLVDADLGSSAKAKFKTTNDQIMKGYYVAYYPFNDAYQNAGGLIPVVSPKEITIEATSTDAAAITKANLKAVGEVTFSYSAPRNVEAGSQVTQFDLSNLSSALRVKIANEGNLAADKRIKSVVLRTRGNDVFVVEGTLKNPSLAPDASVINVAEDGTTATLFARYDTNYPELAKEKTATSADKDTLEVYFPVLPTTLAAGGLDVILIGEDNKACVLDADFSSVTLPAGRRINLNAKVTTDTKFDQSFVTTEQELKTAIALAKTQPIPTTINLLGDIVCRNLNMSGTNAADWKGGVTIVSSVGSKLTLNNPTITTYNGFAADGTDQSSWLTIDAPLTIEGAAINGCVTLKGETTFKGENTIGYATDENTFWWGKLNIEGKATVVKDAKINSIYSWGVTVEEGAELVIEEGAEFINNNFKYNDTAKYKSDLVVKGTMTVNGTLTDKGDTVVEGVLTINGKATNNNKLDVNGGTININGTFNNDAAVTGEEYTLAGNVKVVTGSLNLNDGGKLYNNASLNCMGTFKNDGTFYDYVGSVYGGVPYTSDGTYACYVNSDTRLAEAYNRLNLYAKNKKQTIILQTKSDAYVLNADAAKEVNFENDGNIEIEVAGNKVNKIKSLTVVNNTVTIKGDIMIAGETPITIAKDATIEFENNITVMANGAIVNNGTFDLKPANAGALPAVVYCKSADVTKGTWTNYPLVVADGSFWTGW